MWYAMSNRDILDDMHINCFNCRRLSGQ